MKSRYKFLLLISLVCCAANIFWFFHPRFNLVLFTKVNLAIAFITLIQYLTTKKQKSRRTTRPSGPAPFSEN